MENKKMQGIAKKELYITKISLEDFRINPDLQTYIGRVTIIEDGKEMYVFDSITKFMLSSICDHRLIKSIVITPSINGRIDVYISLEEISTVEQY
jgi:hypothetical protein